MKFFSKEETKITLFIFFILLIISVPNFQKSIIRSRDQIRRDDLGVIQKMVDSYYAKNKVFPKSSSDGKIIACDGKPCQWGQDDFYNLGRIPGDPQSSKGVSYMYYSAPDMYQIFIHQEKDDEVEVSKVVVDRNVKCGTKICNTARSYNCSVDKSIDECAMMILVK